MTVSGCVIFAGECVLLVDVLDAGFVLRRGLKTFRGYAGYARRRSRRLKKSPVGFRLIDQLIDENPMQEDNCEHLQAPASLVVWELGR